VDLGAADVLAGLDLIDGAKVIASGSFDPTSWASTGIEYSVELASSASNGEIQHLLNVVDDVAEIPKALRTGTSVVGRT